MTAGLNLPGSVAQQFALESLKPIKFEFLTPDRGALLGGLLTGIPGLATGAALAVPYTLTKHKYETDPEKRKQFTKRLLINMLLAGGLYGLIAGGAGAGIGAALGQKAQDENRRIRAEHLLNGGS